MLNRRDIQIPVFLRIGAGLLDDLGDILAEQEVALAAPLIVAGRKSAALAGDRLLRAVDTEHMVIVDNNSRASVEAVEAAAQAAGADLLIGFGGGTPLDVAKCAAARSKRNYLSVPTSPSNDGIASPIAVIRTNGKAESLPAAMPVGVVADLELLRQAPPESFRAGLGDLIANVSAVADWDLACRRGRDRMDDFARLLSITGTEAVLRAGGDHKDSPLDPREILEPLIGGLVLSGVAMGIAGSSRPCSGAEHLFSHAIDRRSERPAMHGVQVGLGALMMARLRGGDWEGLRHRMIGLGAEVHASGAGLDEATIIEGLLHARETRPDRYTILDESDLTEASARDLARQTAVT